MVMAVGLIGAAVAVLQDEASFELALDAVGLITRGFSKMSEVAKRDADDASRATSVETAHPGDQLQAAVNAPIGRVRVTSGIFFDDRGITRERLAKQNIVYEEKTEQPKLPPLISNLTIMSRPISAKWFYSPQSGLPQTNIQMLEQFAAFRARSDFDHSIAVQDVASLSNVDNMASSFVMSRPNVKPVKREALPIRSSVTSKSANALNITANRKPQNSPVIFVSRWNDRQRVGLSYGVDIP